MIRLILARHGNTFEAGQIPLQVGARTDLPLTPGGRNQAEQIGTYLRSLQIVPTAIYAGPLKRQVESAALIAQHFSCPLHLHEPALIEIDYGKWEGLTAAEIREKWGQEYNNWTEAGQWPYSIFKGSLEAHLEQIGNWVASLRNTYCPPDTIVAVTSNGLLRFFHDQWRTCAQERQMDRLKVKTGHLCELHLYADRVKVHGWNIDPQKT